MITASSLAITLLSLALFGGTVAEAAVAPDDAQHAVVEFLATDNPAAECEVRTINVGDGQVLCFVSDPHAAGNLMIGDAVIELAGDEDIEADGTGIVVFGGSDGKTFTWSSDKTADVQFKMNADMPKTWIGVRVTPVPEALAAHLQQPGLMIANVAIDSPADQAGLERYDVLTSFNGQPVETMEQLLDAIREVEADARAEITFIHAGAEQRATISPVLRDPEVAVEFRYDEPAHEIHDSAIKYFGHRLMQDPANNWMLQPLGRLDGLPDNIKDMLEDIDVHGSFHWTDEDGGDLPFGFKIDLDGDDLKSFVFEGDEDGHAEVEIQIRVENDGSSTSIHRNADGSITLERTDADGNTTTMDYADVDAMKDADPDAYELYRQFSGYKTHSMFMVPPHKLHDLHSGQQEFQIKLRKQLDAARGHADDAQRRVEKIRVRTEGARARLEEALRAHQDSADGEFSEQQVTIAVDDGQITLTIIKDGTKTQYEFESLDDFKASEPELYEKYGTGIRILQ